MGTVELAMPQVSKRAIEAQSSAIREWLVQSLEVQSVNELCLLALGLPKSSRPFPKRFFDYALGNNAVRFTSENSVEYAFPFQIGFEFQACHYGARRGFWR